MNEEKKQVLENIIMHLGSLHSTLKNYEGSVRKQIFKDKVDKTRFRKQIDADKEPVKADKEQPGFIEKVVKGFAFALFAFLPPLIRLFKEKINFIKALPSKFLEWFNTLGTNIKNLLNEYVVEPLKHFFSVSFMSAWEAIKLVVSDSFEKIMYWPLSILTKIKLFVSEQKVNILTTVNNFFVNSKIGKWIGISDDQLSALNENIKKSIEYQESLKEQQRIREESLRAMEDQSFSEEYEKIKSQREAEYQKEQVETQATQVPSVPIPSSPGTIVKIVEVGPGYNIVELQDGSIIKRTGDRNWRNNNPGNIMYGDYAKSKGAIGTDGRFAIFPTYELGRKAKESLIFEGKNYRDIDLISAIQRYAPPSENDTQMYQNAVLKAVGGQNKLMRDYNSSEKESILNTIQRIEGFRIGKTETIKESQQYAENVKDPGTQAQLVQASTGMTGDTIAATTQESKVPKPKKKRIIKVRSDEDESQLVSGVTGGSRPPATPDSTKAKNLYKQMLVA